MARLIHAGFRMIKNGRQRLFLREEAPKRYVWFEENNGVETPTGIFADTIQEAIRLANQTLKADYFTTFNCGFRYTLPERDEHGQNALFHQMLLSQSSFNGVYFDEELGNNCIVQNIPREAKDLINELKSTGRL